MNIRSNSQLREQLATGNQLTQFHAVVAKVQEKYEPYHTGMAKYEPEEMELNMSAGGIEEVRYQLLVSLKSYRITDPFSGLTVAHAAAMVVPALYPRLT